MSDFRNTKRVLIEDIYGDNIKYPISEGQTFFATDAEVFFKDIHGERFATLDVKSLENVNESFLQTAREKLKGSMVLVKLENSDSYEWYYSHPETGELIPLSVTDKLSAGLYTEPIIDISSYPNNDYFDVESCCVNLYRTPDFTGPIGRYTLGQFRFDTSLLDYNKTYYVVASYENNGATLKIVDSVNLINESNVVPVFTIVITPNNIFYLGWDRLGAGLSNKLHQRLVKTNRFAKESGLALSAEHITTGAIYTYHNGTTYLTHSGAGIKINIASGEVWNGAAKTTLLPVDSLEDNLRFYFKDNQGEWTYVNSDTAINRFQYNDPVTGLKDLGATARFGVAWIFRGILNNKYIGYVLSETHYNSETDAINSSPPESLPDILRTLSLLVGKIVFQRQAGNTNSTFKVINISDLTSSGGSSSIVAKHNDLSGRDEANAHPMSSITPRGTYPVLEVTSGRDTSGNTVDEVPLKVRSLLTSPSSNLQEWSTITGVKSYIDNAGKFIGIAQKATELETSRTINGQSFNGTANIKINPEVALNNTNTSFPIVFTTSAAAASYRAMLVSNGSVVPTINPSTSTIKASTFDGNLTGNSGSSDKVKTSKDLLNEIVFLAGVKEDTIAKTNKEVFTNSNLSYDPVTDGGTLSTPNIVTDRIVAGEIVGTVSGSSDSAEQVKTIQNGSNSNLFLTFVDSNTTTKTSKDVYTHANIKYNPALNGGTLNIPSLVAGTITATEFNIVHAEDVYTENDHITLRDGATNALAAGQYTGLIAKIPDGVRDAALIFDGNGMARVGDISYNGSVIIYDDTQALVTRHDTPTSNSLFYWNASQKRMDSTNILWDGSKLNGNLDGTLSGTFSGASSGTFDGAATGTFNGASSGTFDGDATGTFDGAATGTFNGASTGTFDGAATGTFAGSGSGSFDGNLTGTFDGDATGTFDGAATGTFSGASSGTFDGIFNGTLGQVEVGEIKLSDRLVINGDGIFATDSLGNEIFSLFSNTGNLSIRDIRLDEVNFTDQELFKTSDVEFNKIKYSTIYLGETRKDTLWDLAYAQRGSVIGGNKLTWNSGTGQLDLDILSHGDVDFADQNLLTTSNPTFSSINITSNILPVTTGTGAIGNSSFKWGSGWFKGINVDDNLLLGGSLIHQGDEDTKISFGTDSIDVIVGNKTFIKIIEDDTQDLIEFGDGTDTDFSFKSKMLLEGNTGNLGIGNIAPLSKLHVTGDIRLTGSMITQGAQYNHIWASFKESLNGSGLYLGAGGLTVVGGGESSNVVKENLNESSEELILSSDLSGTSSAIRFITSLQTDWASRVEAMTIRGDGNIGIGTITPSHKLTINGDLRLNNAVLFNGTNAYPRIRRESGDLHFDTNTLAYAMTIKDGGNVGIGALTPTFKLEVVGPTKIYDNNQTNGKHGLEVFKNQDAGYSGLFLRTGHYENTNRYHILARTASAGGDLDKFWINHKGEGFISNRLGIGATAPAAHLTVHDSANSNTYLQITNKDTGSLLTDGLVLLQTGLNSTFINRENGYMSFETNNLERVRILSSGNVGVGITNPIVKLDVAGEIRSSGNIYASALVNGMGEFVSVNDGNVQIKSGGYSAVVATFVEGGNVGIGTTTPTETLEVVGNTKISNKLQVGALSIEETDDYIDIWVT